MTTRHWGTATTMDNTNFLTSLVGVVPGLMKTTGCVLPCFRAVSMLCQMQCCKPWIASN